MTQQEKTEYAKAFIEKIVNGVDPVTGGRIPENDLFSDVKVLRHMFSVLNILNKVTAPVKNSDAQKFREFKFIVDEEGTILTDIGLLSYLRDLRLKIAREINRPAYYVMANSCLVTLATYCPVTKEQFVNLYGLGEGKYSIYGTRFVDAIIEYGKSHFILEAEKIGVEKSYIGKIVDGVNPETGEEVSKDNLLNTAPVLRCMFYIYEILNNLSIFMGQSGCQKPDVKDIEIPKKPVKGMFYIDEERLGSFAYSESGITVSEIVRRLNELADTEEVKQLKPKQVFAWLEENGLVYSKENTVTGKKFRKATDKGRALGFNDEQRLSAYGYSYVVIICDKNAQRYIVENANFFDGSDNNTNGYHVSEEEWQEEHDKKLIDMFNDGLTAESMAQELSRTADAVRDRLVKLGLIKHRSDIA